MKQNLDKYDSNVNRIAQLNEGFTLNEDEFLDDSSLDNLI